MNRTQSPDFKTNFDITFQQAQHKTLGNGCALHYIHAGSQELVKIDFEFYAGTAFQTKPLTASFTNRLLKEGTSKHSAKQIADIIDFYGAFLETDCGNDTASVTLYALNKHLEHLIPLVYEIMFDATFPDNEFETYRTNALQKYYTRQKKVSDVASAKFGEMLYGGSNFYGYKVEEIDYKNLQVNDIRTFYKQFYKLENAVLIASGKVDEHVLQLLQNNFGNVTLSKTQKELSKINIATTTNQKQYIEIEGALQSAIRVGRTLFSKQHEDFLPMLVLNTILGGYFGSRLMANIREDKGYTYGIGSGISTKIHGGHFSISTEVGADVTNLALVEIYKEIDTLRTKLVDVEELELVKNYLLGTFLRSIDGAFALAQKFTGIYFYDLTYDYYKKYFETIRSITPEELKDLANRYLQEKDLLELVVGKK
jgi:predicted Zn-dependent peptidase